MEKPVTHGKLIDKVNGCNIYKSGHNTPTYTVEVPKWAMAREFKTLKTAREFAIKEG